MIIEKKDILVLGEELIRWLDNTSITAEAKYSIGFTVSKKKFCLSLHYNGNNIFLYVNSIKLYQRKAKDSEIKPYLLCLGSILNNFTVFTKCTEFYRI